MNERIQKLIKQATILEDGDLFVREVFDKEKFAELIITDVIDILSTYRGKILFHDGFEYNCEHPIISIQKHFGVE